MNFAPVLDVNKNPVIGDRAFGNEPSLVRDFGVQNLKELKYRIEQSVTRD